MSLKMFVTRTNLGTYLLFLILREIQEIREIGDVELLREIREIKNTNLLLQEPCENNFLLSERLCLTRSYRLHSLYQYRWLLYCLLTVFCLLITFCIMKARGPGPHWKPLTWRRFPLKRSLYYINTRNKELHKTSLVVICLWHFEAS